MLNGSKKNDLSEDLLRKFQQAISDNKTRAEMMEEWTPTEMTLFRTWKRTEALERGAISEPMRDEAVEASARDLMEPINEINEDNRTAKVIKPGKK